MSFISTPGCSSQLPLPPAPSSGAIQYQGGHCGGGRHQPKRYSESFISTPGCSSQLPLPPAPSSGATQYQGGHCGGGRHQPKRYSESFISTPGCSSQLPLPPAPSSGATLGRASESGGIAEAPRCRNGPPPARSASESEGVIPYAGRMAGVYVRILVVVVGGGLAGLRLGTIRESGSIAEAPRCRKVPPPARSASESEGVTPCAGKRGGWHGYKRRWRGYKCVY